MSDGGLGWHGVVTLGDWRSAMHIAGRERMIASAGHKTRRTRLATMLGRSSEDDAGNAAAGREDTIAAQVGRISSMIEHEGQAG